MKTKNPNFKIVAKAVRTELESKSNRFFIVFEIVDEEFKNQIKKNWDKDVELRVLDKNLVIEEEE